jgi:tRNA(fMet)-specific endonuclease VapC
MPGRLSLDSNIVIALFAEDEEVVRKTERCDEVFVASVVLGELYYGAQDVPNGLANEGLPNEVGP